ncbi:MAG: hypothetical protein ACRD1T_21525, partial [Acidimicrobiia bacterium]
PLDSGAGSCPRARGQGGGYSENGEPPNAAAALAATRFWNGRLTLERSIESPEKPGGVGGNGEHSEGVPNLFVYP